MRSEDAATLRLASDTLSAIARALHAQMSEDAIAVLLHEVADALTSGEIQQLAEAVEEDPVQAHYQPDANEYWRTPATTQF